MANRRKSLQDLYNQTQRIIDRAQGSSRGERALDTYFRYMNNIQNMRSNERQRQKAIAQIDANGRSRFAENNDLSEVAKFKNQLNNRKVSRNTYMGNNGG